MTPFGNPIMFTLLHAARHLSCRPRFKVKRLYLEESSPAIVKTFTLGTVAALRRVAAFRKWGLKVRTRQKREPKKRLQLRRRPRNVPAFWRKIDAGLYPLFVAGQKDYGPHGIRRLQWLVLASRRIPCMESSQGNLYVPPMYERWARNELLAYTRENRPPQPLPPPFAYHNEPWMLLALLGLVIWHGIVVHWWPGTDAWLSTAAWEKAGSLDVFRTAHLGEWWRCLTALTLHSDTGHLLANVAFGAPFLIMLGKRTGAGPALLLTVLAGALGNACNALYRPLSHNSLGFSTALFGIVGLLAALSAVRTTGKGRMLLPLAAGVGILASLGTGDIEGRVDYGAHIFGLLAGLVLGGFYGKLLHRWSEPSYGWRLACALGAILLLIAAWCRALSV